MREDDLHFFSNLRLACSTWTSISDLCRKIGINRQQFNRYINGNCQPSAHNQLRIAAAFGLEPADFHRTPPVFRAKLKEAKRPKVMDGPWADAFSGNAGALQPYLGFYQTWHISLSWPDHVVCSCAHLRESQGQVLVTSLERIDDLESGIRQRSRYAGLVAFQRNRIFITEVTRGEAPTFGQTILLPFEVHQRQFLRGLTMGLSWRNDNLPYATRTIWRYRGMQTDKRALLKTCGIYPTTSGALPSVVSSFLLQDGAVMTLPTHT
ncbi:helix-turn-helix transcriptional regulator [Tianweitania sp. BSSL-BM11]|uniref:Helix-turn-helix transcriptional regulator n=1 Tax=Tianweitania aestuarii TaxID=2814886 RepID=A0ABS5RYW9_9HYPH|nr:helix-turn-helix transcriptional regulator [Tianweitania aestuarii]MBS9721970.1 helix-turn-helix transcriptional regulator [Tianweitania aestuarii]